MRTVIRPSMRLTLTLLALLVLMLPRPASAQFRDVTGPCGLSFPTDHGPHPDYRTEWWYWTGTLATEDGRRFGFQLTFFRRAMIAPGEVEPPAEPSAWRTSQLYLAHAHVADVSGGRFLHEEKAARGAVGLAGADLTGDTAQVFLGPWSADLGPEEHRLAVRGREFSFDLTLRPEKPPVLHGQEGYSRKGRDPASASCYYSFTRLAARGTLAAGGREYRVTGGAWMDHEFSTALIEPGLAGWDWFSLRLTDGSELMVFFQRAEAGGLSPASAGTFVAADGSWRHIEASDLGLEILDHWRSPHSGGRYPSRWRLTVRSLSLDLTIGPELADQEMATAGSSGLTYWEGAVSASGTRTGSPVRAEGYVEMTGYAGSLSGRL